MKCLLSLPSRIACFFKGHRIERREVDNGWINVCDRCGNIKGPTLNGFWYWFWSEIE